MFFLTIIRQREVNVFLEIQRETYIELRYTL